ncbi:MAG: endonuclease/exonuclease/phosphatase family protein [Limnochordales bacterium]|nr:endonuclease/exonuclease/phosphatase family protein [Limnochordales bacterium]
MRLRLMSYNIQIGVGSARNPRWDPTKFDLEAVARVIEAASPDIVALQEVDRYRARSGHVDQVEWLSRRLNFAWHAYAPAYYALEPSAPPAAFAHGEYGVALLSRWPIRAQFVHPLYRRARLEPGERPWDIEPRVALETILELPAAVAIATAAGAGTYVTVVCTHWSTAQDQRLVQAEEIKQLAGRSVFPAVVMGDLNCTPDSPEFQALLADFDDALALAGVTGEQRLSWPSGTAARQAIDHILLHRKPAGRPTSASTSPSPSATATPDPGAVWRWQVVSAEVVRDTTLASDHNPVLVEVELWAAPDGLRWSARDTCPHTPKRS